MEGPCVVDRPPNIEIRLTHFGFLMDGFFGRGVQHLNNPASEDRILPNTDLEVVEVSTPSKVDAS